MFGFEFSKIWMISCKKKATDIPDSLNASRAILYVSQSLRDGEAAIGHLRCVRVPPLHMYLKFRVYSHGQSTSADLFLTANDERELT